MTAFYSQPVPVQQVSLLAHLRCEVKEEGSLNLLGHKTKRMNERRGVFSSSLEVTWAISGLLATKLTK